MHLICLHLHRLQYFLARNWPCIRLKTPIFLASAADGLAFPQPNLCMDGSFSDQLCRQKGSLPTFKNLSSGLKCYILWVFSSPLGFHILVENVTTHRHPKSRVPRGVPCIYSLLDPCRRRSRYIFKPRLVRHHRKHCYLSFSPRNRSPRECTDYIRLHSKDLYRHQNA